MNLKRGWALWKDVILTTAGLFGIANEAGFHHESQQINLLIVYVAMLGIGAPDLLRSVKLARSPKPERGDRCCAIAPTCPFWKPPPEREGGDE